MKKNGRKGLFMPYSLKFNLAMKLTVILLVVSIFSVQANGYGQKTKVTFDLDHVEMREVLETIESLTDFKFLYNDKKIDAAKLVSIKALNEPLSEVLDELFEGTSIYYVLRKKQIVLKVRPLTGQSALPKEKIILNIEKDIQRSVSGLVTDDKGLPLSGANILEKGTNNGTQADFDGNFSIEVADDNSILVISYIGFASKESTLTGAVSAVKGSELVISGAANISETMAGRISGLSIEPVSGEPGVNPVIRIRGIGTTGSSNPLVVIDGIIRDNLADIDPTIIESVSVLKDAAAVAAYGVGGANGVLLITTKTGNIGEPLISFGAYYGNQKPTWLPNPLNAVDYMKLQNEATTNVSSSTPPPFTSDYINNYNENHATDPDMYPDARPSDLLNTSIPVQNYTLTASGGSGSTSYFLGGGYFQQDGFFDQIKFNRYNFNANIKSKITESTTISANVIYSFGNKDELAPSYSSSSMLRWLYFVKPISPLYFSNGKWGDSNNTSLVGGLNSGSYNKVNRASLLNTISVDQQLPFVKGLSVNGTFSFDLNNNFTKGFSQPAYYWTQDLTTTPYTYTENVSNMEQSSLPNPALYESYSNGQTFTYQGIVNYHRTFDVHDITFLGVAELRKSNYKNLNASMINFELAIDEFDLGSSNTSDYSIGGSSSEATQVGYVYKAGYIYDNKYMVEVAGRYDGHYYFAPGKRFGFFPSFSVGWRLSEERFMESFDFINSLKLRGSWGKSGNLAGSAYQFLAGYSFNPNQYAFGGNMVPGAYPNNEANPNITWEVSNKSNVGIEANLWKNLLTIEADYFYERRNGMLLPPAITVPFEYGIGLSDENEGVMDNHGFEIAIGSIHQFQNGLKLELSGNFSFARNKMVNVFESAATYDNPNRRRTGRPINTPFGYRATGLFSTSDDINGDGIIDGNDGYNIVQFSELHPGDIIYEDINKDGKIDSNDEVPIGYSTYPEITYGFTPAIEWKGFDLALFFQGVGRNSLDVNNRFQTISLYNTQSNTDYEYYNNRWTPENENARYPRAYIGPNPNNNSVNSSFWYVKADYLRLKNATLGYSIPKSILKNINNLRVYFTGTNIFTFSKVDFFDPEAIQRGGGAGNYPAMKQYIFGMKLTL